MIFDIFLDNEIDGLECEWDNDIIISDEILKEVDLTRKDLEKNWLKGRVKIPWTCHLVNEVIHYPKGAIILYDNQELYYIQRSE